MQMLDSQFSMLLLLGLLLVVICLLALVMILSLMQNRRSEVPLEWMNKLLAQQVNQNQLLMNQLRAQTPQDLHSLNYATMPQQQESQPSPGYSGVLDPDLARVLDQEEELARMGYQSGELDDDLAGQGWSAPAYRSANSDFGTPTVLSD